MAIVKYKVIGSVTDRFYYSQIVDVDNSIYATSDDQIEFIGIFFVMIASSLIQMIGKMKVVNALIIL